MNALILLLCCCQDPSPPASGPAALDVIELKNGDQFEGHITAEVDGYIELQLDAGATVGISRAQVAAVRRGQGAVAPASGPMPASNEWFVLHDAQGLAVGWLHAATSNEASGVCTISEEYEFQDGRRRYQVTSLCTTDARWTPTSCYFRERISDPLMPSLAMNIGQPDRILDERIVEASCQGDRLHVARLDRAGRRERDLEWGPDSTFPLLARTKARHTGLAVAATAMFDPACEEVVTRGLDAARLRTVMVDGKPLQITEIAETSAAGRNAEWLDASQHTIRRELAGPALVAMPSSAESARLAIGGVASPSAIVSEPGGEFGLWLPNPAWQVGDHLQKGQVVLGCEAHGASVALSRLDHLAADATLDAAVAAVANWFALLHPELRIESQESVVIRDRTAQRLHASGRLAATKVQATVDVIPNHGQFLVLVCRAPSSAWAELAADFDFLVRSIELSPQGLAPKLQGPLSERGGAHVAPKPKPMASAGSAPLLPPATPRLPAGPVVRIPNDG